ncbi:MAG: alpha/beta hydrolase [Burkholderiales bacterium]
MPIESIAGLRVHTQAAGDHGPRIVLLHGMIVGSLANWYFSISPFLSRDHRLLMYDLRGHGLSERPPDGYGVGSMAADLTAIVDRFAGDEPVTVVGHSFGAIAALRFALDHPQRVHRLVVVEAPLPITASTTAEVMLADVRGGGGGGDVAADIALTPEFIERLVNESVDSALSTLPEELQAAFRARGRRGRRLVSRASALVLGTSIMTDLMQAPDIADDELRACRRPVLLCYGAHTLPVMTATCERLASVLPDVRVRTFDAGHFLPREKPAELAQAIREFVDG